MAQRFTLWKGLSQPPDYRTYSAEVTGFRRNLPHHRRLRLFRRPVIIQHSAVCVKPFFEKFSADFLPFPPGSLGSIPINIISGPLKAGRTRIFLFMASAPTLELLHFSHRGGNCPPYRKTDNQFSLLPGGNHTPVFLHPGSH